jgi:hypothetical protein
MVVVFDQQRRRGAVCDGPYARVAVVLVGMNYNQIARISMAAQKARTAGNRVIPEKLASMSRRSHRPKKS